MRRFRLLVIALIALVLLGGLDIGPGAQARISGWDDAGSLSAPRSYARAVVLSNGEVLVTDGLVGGRDVIASGTELFDPRTGRVSFLPGRTGRVNSVLTALRDGRAIVTGGADRIGGSWHDMRTVELFDRRAREWRTSRPMRVARADHGAAVLVDGRVLVVGGHRDSVFLDSVELFDPASETWRDAAALPKPRAHFSIATLPDGRVLVAGGFEAGLPSRTSVLYDPRRDAWSAGPDLAVERALHATVVLPNGDVMLIGGQRAAAASAERFDFKRGVFAHAGSLVRGRMLAMAAALRDGRVVVAGGLPRPAQLIDTFAPTNTTEVYDAERNTWLEGPALAQAVAFSGTAVTRTGLWLFGGAAEDEAPTERIQVLR